MSRWCNRELYVEDDEQFSISDFGGDAASYWKYARNLRAGTNLPNLAIAVLSIAANTATCERHFSEVGRVHTATRNCLKPDKANKSAAMRQAVRDRDRFREESTKAECHDIDAERTEEDREGNKYVSRIIKPDERPFRSESLAYDPTALDMSVSEVSARSNETSSRHLSTNISSTAPTHYGARTPSRPPIPIHPHNCLSSMPDSLTMSDDLPDQLNPSRRLDFSSAGTHQMQDDAAFVAPVNGERANLNSPHSLEYSSNMLANNGILAHWRWLYDEIPDSLSIDGTSAIDGRQAIDGAVQESRMFGEYVDNDQPDVVMDGEDDSIRLRGRPIPPYNDPQFPQEKTLAGMRGKKATLKELFYLPSVTPA